MKIGDAEAEMGRGQGIIVTQRLLKRIPGRRVIARTFIFSMPVLKKRAAVFCSAVWASRDRGSGDRQEEGDEDHCCLH